MTFSLKHTLAVLSTACCFMALTEANAQVAAPTPEKEPAKSKISKMNVEAEAGSMELKMAEGKDGKGEESYMEMKDGVSITMHLIHETNEDGQVQEPVVLTMTSNTLKLFLEPKKDAPKAAEAQPAAQTGDNLDIRRMEAHGNVVVRQVNDGQSAEGDEAVYDRESQVIVITGHAKLHQKDGVIVGNQFTYTFDDIQKLKDGKPLGTFKATKSRLVFQIPVKDKKKDASKPQNAAPQGK